MGTKFKVGDKVRVIDGHEGLVGKVGIISHPPNDSEIDCVEFEDWNGGHDGDYDDGRKTCWYFHEESLELVSDPNSHYHTRIQPIETMQANMTPEEFQGFCKGSIIKYACRCGRKDDPLKEALKIVDYANWLVSSLKGEIINPHNEEEGGERGE